MCYIVLDMEWNIAGNKQQMKTEPFPLEGEIIQIGAVKLNENLEKIDSYEATIKPAHYPVINKKIQEITLITDEAVSKGVSFRAAIDSFKAWCGDNPVIFTWGDADIPMLEDNLAFNCMDCKWIPESYDVQWMFDDLVTGENRRYSLDYARFRFGIKGRNAHNALNDALNTADVLNHLDVGGWLEEERKYRSECDNN